MSSTVQFIINVNAFKIAVSEIARDGTYVGESRSRVKMNLTNCSTVSGERLTLQIQITNN